MYYVARRELEAKCPKEDQPDPDPATPIPWVMEGTTGRGQIIAAYGGGTSKNYEPGIRKHREGK